MKMNLTSEIKYRIILSAMLKFNFNICMKSREVFAFVVLRNCGKVSNEFLIQLYWHCGECIDFIQMTAILIFDRRQFSLCRTRENILKSLHFWRALKIFEAILELIRILVFTLLNKERIQSVYYEVWSAYAGGINEE